MKSDAYWFTHFANAKDNSKLLPVFEQLGIAGYGIYNILLEMLCAEPGYKLPISILPSLAKRYSSTPEMFVEVVNNYGLFVVEESQEFYCPDLNSVLQKLTENRLKKSEGGKLGNKIRWGNSVTDRSEIGNRSQIENTKTEDITTKKEKQHQSKPTIGEVKEFFSSKGYMSQVAEQFYYRYNANGWCDQYGDPIKNWMQLATAWFKEENKIATAKMVH